MFTRRNTMRIYLLAILLICSYSISLKAGEVTDVNVWLNQYRSADLSDSYCAFYTDIWGTVEQFASVSLMSPTGNIYSLSLEDEGDQWGSGQDGTCTDIASEFTDGAYTFEVIYTNNTSESIEVLLGGQPPEFPSNVVYDNGVISWDQWQNPIYPVWIEVEWIDPAIEWGGNWVVSHTATNFTIPSEFLIDNTVYELALYFVSSQYTGGYKASVTTSIITTATADIDKDGHVNLIDFRLLADAWLTQLGDIQWNGDCDLTEPWDIIDLSDLNVLVNQWMMGN